MTKYEVRFVLEVRGTTTGEDIKRALMRKVDDWTFIDEETDEEIFLDTVDYWEKATVARIP